MRGGGHITQLCMLKPPESESESKRTRARLAGCLLDVFMPAALQETILPVWTLCFAIGRAMLHRRCMTLIKLLRQSCHRGSPLGTAFAACSQGAQMRAGPCGVDVDSAMHILVCGWGRQDFPSKRMKVGAGSHRAGRWICTPQKPPKHLAKCERVGGDFARLLAVGLGRHETGTTHAHGAVLVMLAVDNLVREPEVNQHDIAGGGGH
mmetsp:Transcript_23883/g.63034  ORF Transcript_23883/g.63034 Transcript_23883/m.63034 type:complete len:207 (-) Transcript_23883:6-626(-)